MNLITIPKKTGTYADALVTIGIADLITEIYESNEYSIEPEILDMGYYYQIILPKEIGDDELIEWLPSPGYEYVKFKDPDPLAPSIYFDYENEKAKEQKYREYLKTNAEKKGRGEVLNLNSEGSDGSMIIPPDPKLGIMKTMAALKATSSYCKMHDTVRHAPIEFGILVGSKLGITTQKNTIHEKPFNEAVSTLQLFNPVSGKGVNRPKPDGAPVNSAPDKLRNWFEEWMKYRAFSKCSLAFMFGNEGKDSKVLVLAPKNIGPTSLEKIQKELLTKRFYGSVNLDIHAVLTLTEVIIKNSQEFCGQASGISLLRKTPRHIIAGLYQAYFKSLGSASALMNVSFLGVPDWFPITSKTDAEYWLEIIAEHKHCLNSLKEKYSDDIPVLIVYRTFLSTGDFMDALEFFVLYAIHYMKKKAANEWVEPFTVKNLGRLFMANENIQEVIKDEGFQNLATAIRKSTVNQQIAKGKTGKSDYEIQYGLAQEWKRRMHDKNELIVTIAEFAQKYNAENAKRLEQGKASRRRLTEEDINRVFALIEKTNNPKLVGSLLLAYGYAKASNEDQQDITGDQVTTDENE